MKPTPKKTRALPRVWKSFFRIPVGERFHIGEIEYLKNSFFTAVQESGFVCEIGSRFVAPWTRVRSSQLVRDARPGGKSSINPLAGKIPEGDCCYQESCYDVPRQYQPHNDNKTSGPTS